MSVTKMKKLSVCALKTNRKRILEGLQHLGCVQFEYKKSEGLDVMDTSNRRLLFNRKAKQLSEALALLDEYAPENKSLLDSLNGKAIISTNEYNKIVAQCDSICEIADEIIAIKKSIRASNDEISALNSELVSLEPWMSLDVSFKKTKTKYTSSFFGTLPATVDIDAIVKGASDAGVVITLISEDKLLKYVNVVVSKSAGAEIKERLREAGFVKPTIESSSTPLARKDEISVRIADIKVSTEAATSKLVELADKRESIRAAADYYAIREEKYETLGKISQSKNVFFLSGYVPSDSLKSVEALLGALGAYYEVENADEAPVLLKNNTFSSSFEGVLASFGLPKKGELDPSFFMSIFYVFLFGLMLSDAAYGAIVFIACFFILKKCKGMEEGLKKSIRMFMYCGISTLFWGVLFGGYFGDAISVVSKTFFGKTVIVKPLWFEPLKNPMKLLLYSMLFGLIHLGSGLALKGYSLLRDKDIKGFIFDVLSWFLILGGLIAILLNSSIYASLSGASVELGSIGKQVAIVAAAVGAIIVILFGGRPTKNPAIRVAKGLYGLYDVTSWLSDLLSYSRLLALGLATGVIAQVVNQMGSMLGNSVGGIILFIIVFIFGHTFNLAINILGAYVHTNRLQYVEFFGKFYEGGGEPFTPFKENTKYVNIKDN